MADPLPDRSPPRLSRVAASSVSNADSPDAASSQQQLMVHQLEVVYSELKSLPPTQPVFQKRGALFFKSDIHKLMNSQQKELDKAKKRLKKS